MTSINGRILRVISVKARGNQKRFSDLMGWTPQYVGKMVKEGGSVGIEPVKQILEKFTDIDGRWLTIGEGEMIIENKLVEIRSTIHTVIRDLLDIEKYLPFMSPEEIEHYSLSTKNLNYANFTEKQIKRWNDLFNQRELERSSNISTQPGRRTKRTENAK